jgi:alpha-amylase/alpha-mannosidase (GH57 family)
LLHIVQDPWSKGQWTKILCCRPSNGWPQENFLLHIVKTVWRKGWKWRKLCCTS